MNGIYALYSQGEDAQRAVNGLRASGLSDKDITVISCTPMEDFEFSHINGKNHLWYVACLGGLIGLLGSTALLTFTSNAWEMNVGNMKPISWWAFLIPVFELTMLGSILATVFTLIATAGLLRRRPKLYDPAVSDGMILVGVDNFAGASQQQVESALRVAPGVTLKTI